MQNKSPFHDLLFCILPGLHYLCMSFHNMRIGSATMTDCMVKAKCACTSLLAAAMLAGCNDDVFIDNFMTEVPQVLLSEEDSCAAVRFDASNWGVLKCYSLYGGMDMSATTLGGEPQELPWHTGGNGRLDYGDRFLDFHLEKTGGGRLDMTLRENLYDEPVRMYIEVGNEYETRMLEPLLMPTPKYTVDSVAYDWGSFSSWSEDPKVEIAYSTVVDNRGSSQPVSVRMYPYRYSKRIATFYASDANWVEHNYRRVFGNSLPKIEIPDVTDGEAAMQGTEVEFGVARQTMDYGRDTDFSIDIKVEAGAWQEITIANGIRTYSVPYTVYASCPWSGRRRIYSGTLVCSCPEGYLVAKHDMGNSSDE